MSESRRQLTLFNCCASGGPFSKRSQVEHATSSSSLDVTATDGTISELQPVQVSEVCNISDNESSVSSIYDDLMIQSPTVGCHTPIFIDSSSDEASFPAIFSPYDEPSQLGNSQHSTPAITSYPSSTATGTTVSTLTVTGTTVTSSGSIQESQPSDIAQTPAFSPTRPVNMKFPTTRFGNTTRSFNPI